MTRSTHTCEIDEQTTTSQPQELLNYFDEGIFAHNTNGTILGIRPEHISLAESRSLGSIPATVKDWEVRGEVCRVTLIIKDRDRETHFRADLPAGHPLVKNLHRGMILYMRFAWDKVQEYDDHRCYGWPQAAA